MLIRYDGKCVVVVGAARGIGRAIARAFAADGAHVLACDVLLEEVKAFSGPVTGGGAIHPARVDVTELASIEAALAEVERQWGRLDVLVYVAGGVLGQSPAPIEQVSPEAFTSIIDVNLKGAFLFLKASVPLMKKTGSGRIITISSRAGLATSLTGIQSYAAAKHGQIGLVKQLAQELGAYGITVNSVAPGFMATSPDYERQWNSYTPEFRASFAERIAMRRMGEPDDIAHAVIFLASDYASWITGQILPVTGSPVA
jgi:3-oxoacyl-[acyl-carrier protein] reductase